MSPKKRAGQAPDIQHRRGFEGVSAIKGQELVEVVPLRFDYSALSTEVAEQAMEAAREIKRRDRDACQEMVAIGQRLTEIKALLPGRFTEWVETEFDYGTTMVRQLMAVAERFGDKTTLSVALSPTTMRLLSSSLLSEGEVADLTDAAEGEGRRLTVKEVNAAFDRKRAAALTEAATLAQAPAPVVGDRPDGGAVRVDIEAPQARRGVGVLAAAGPERGGVAGEAQEPLSMNTRTESRPPQADLRSEAAAIEVVALAPTRTHVCVELEVELRDRLVQFVQAGHLSAFFAAEEVDRLLDQLGEER